MTPAAETDPDTKICPVCGETIKAVAIKCRFCNTDLEEFAAQKEAQVEHTLFKGHPAVFYHFGQWAVLLIAAGVAVAFMYESDAFGISELLKGQPKSVLQIARVFPILFPLGIVLYYWIKALGRTFEVTTQRIRIERGFLSTEKDTLELFRIDHFEIHKPIGMRILGLCELHLDSSDKDFQTVILYGIRGLEALADKMRECSLHERSRRQVTTFVQA